MRSSASASASPPENTLRCSTAATGSPPFDVAAGGADDDDATATRSVVTAAAADDDDADDDGATLTGRTNTSTTPLPSSRPRATTSPAAQTSFSSGIHTGVPTSWTSITRALSND